MRIRLCMLRYGRISMHFRTPSDLFFCYPTLFYLTERLFYWKTIITKNNKTHKKTVITHSEFRTINKRLLYISLAARFLFTFTHNLVYYYLCVINKCLLAMAFVSYTKIHYSNSIQIVYFKIRLKSF